MKASETELAEEVEATLEMTDGGARVTVFVTVRPAEGVPVGYLRLAYGQGNYINRLLNSVGQTARLIDASGRAHGIRLVSSEPKNVPGYMCSFLFCETPPAQGAGADAPAP